MFLTGLRNNYFLLLHFSSSDKTVKVWDAGSRQCIQTFYEHNDQVMVELNNQFPLVLQDNLVECIHMYYKLSSIC